MYSHAAKASKRSATARISSSVIPGSPMVFDIAIISSPSAPNLPLHGRVLGLWELCDVIATEDLNENENRVCTKVSPV